MCECMYFRMGSRKLKYFWIFFTFFVILMPFTFYISDFDGLALGNQLMVFRSRWCQLCKNIWSWSKSSDSQRNMEGNYYCTLTYLCLVIGINFCRTAREIEMRVEWNNHLFAFLSSSFCLFVWYMKHAYSGILIITNSNSFLQEMTIPTTYGIKAGSEIIIPFLFTKMNPRL